MQFSLEFDADDSTQRVSESLRLFDEYVQHRASGKSPLRPQSVTMYRHRIRKLSVFLSVRGRTVVTASVGDLDAFLLELGDAATTRARYLALVKDICVWYAVAYAQPVNQASQSILESPRYRFVHYRSERMLPPALTPEQQERVLKFFITPPTDCHWRRVRDWALCALLMGSGLRPGQAHNLRCENLVYPHGVSRLNLLSEEPRTVIAPGDGISEPHEAPITPWARSALRIWFGTYRDVIGLENLLEHNGWVFPTKTDGMSPVTKSTMSDNFIRLCEEMGFRVKGVGLLALRSTFAARQLAAGHVVEDVQQWLGIKDKGAMARYRRVAPGVRAV